MPINQYRDEKARPIDVQRQNAIRGNIRLGARKVDPKRPGKPLDTFRFTCVEPQVLHILAGVYGGQVVEWKERKQYELVSEASSIPVVIDTSYTIDDRYELYDGKTLTRKCNGETCYYLQVDRSKGENQKVVIDRGEVPCICARLEGMICKMGTYVRVLLPDSGDLAPWQLDTRSVVANKEMHGFIESLKQRGIQNAYSILSIREIESLSGVVAKKFKVPTLTLDQKALETHRKFQGALALTMPSWQKALAAPSGTSSDTDGSQDQTGTQGSTDANVAQKDKAAEWLKSKGWFSKDYEEPLGIIKTLCADKNRTLSEVVTLAIEAGLCDTLADLESFASRISEKPTDALFAEE